MHNIYATVLFCILWWNIEIHLISLCSFEQIDFYSNFISLNLVTYSLEGTDYDLFLSSKRKDCGEWRFTLSNNFQPLNISQTLCTNHIVNKECYSGVLMRYFFFSENRRSLLLSWVSRLFFDMKISKQWIQVGWNRNRLDLVKKFSFIF